MIAAKASLLIAVFAASIASAGDAPEVDPHILKEGRAFPGPIPDPYAWTLIQLADGPITGSGVSDYARIVIAYGLREAHADLDGDGEPELLLRGGAPSRSWQALAFRRSAAGFHYMGDFGSAHLTVVHPERRVIVVFEPNGGHFGFIREYEIRADRFVLISSEGLSAGDGAPESNNQRIEQLFPAERILKWEKVARQARPDDGG